MTCTTCHDPHGSPSAAERSAFYRQRCLGCHNNQAGFAERHHPENPDCTACHMARPPSNDIAHEQVTDHWIRKKVDQKRLPPATGGRLVAVGGLPAGDRDLGLAYAQMAARGDRPAAETALRLLQSAETAAAGARNDHELHSQLGFLYQVAGHTEAAAAQYRLALASDPYDSLAGGNLALIVAQQRRYGEAIRLWSSVFEHDPVELAAGLNLAAVECGTGQRGAALATLDRLLLFSPDDQSAKGLAREIASGQRHCPAP